MGPSGSSSGSNKDASNERMMSMHVRGLIDTCFEEGHYESGLDVFDKALTPNTYPAPYHIRVLLFLALYPPPTPAPVAPPVSSTLGGPPLSPRKERYRKNMTPTPAASAQALHLLRLLIQSTSTPSNLLRGLPSREKTFLDTRGGWQVDPSSALFLTSSASEAKDAVTFIPDQGACGDENKIVRAALAFTVPKDIWTCLEDGFVKGIDNGPSVDLEDEIMGLKTLGNQPKAAKKGKGAKGKGKKRKAEYEDDEYEGRDRHRGRQDAYDPFGDEPKPARLPVSDHAWPVLDWLLEVFEKDEKSMQAAGSTRHSPLLMYQVLGSGQFDLAVPLKITFAALVSGVQRQDRFVLGMGMRLLHLIINLTSPAPPRCLSPSECLRQIHTSLLSTLNAHGSTLPTNFLSSFFTGLPPPAYGFKLRLAGLYLMSRSVDGDTAVFLGGPASGGALTGGPGASGSPARPKPAVRRPAPRGAQAAAAVSMKPDSTISTASVSTIFPAAPSSAISPDPFPIPAVEDVLEALVLLPDLSTTHPDDNEDSASVSSAPATPRTEGGDDDEEGDLRLLRCYLDHATAKLQVLAAAMRLVVEPRQPATPSHAQLVQKWTEAVRKGRLRKTIRRAFAPPKELTEAEENFDMEAEGDGTASSLRSKLDAIRTASEAMLVAWEHQAKI